ncbi:IMP dehydrogenase [Streptomyces nodosus]|uniref:IMP dehydrogenase n=1 Tax=Streptomyces nodosus TaxID=40318 RepID=UPI00380475E2
MRPIRFALDYDDVLLVPQRTSVTSKNTDLSTILAPGLELAIPVLSANTPWCTEAPMATAMALAGGLGVLHRACTPAQQTAQLDAVKNAPFPADSATASADGNGRLRAAAAVGAAGDWKERAAMLVNHDVDALIVDIAHGHADHVLDVVVALKKQHPSTPVIAGTVVTAAGTRDLINAGADAVKVGIATRTARLVAGTGVPQLTAVMDCAAAAGEYGVPVIASGGIRTSADLVKALAAGATTTMLGSALAGADESPTRGNQVPQKELDEHLPTCVGGTHTATGPLERTLRPFLAGLRSGMSYSGAATLDQLRGHAEFVQVSQMGVTESRSHAPGLGPQIPLDCRAEG